MLAACRKSFEVKMVKKWNVYQNFSNCIVTIMTTVN